MEDKFLISVFAAFASPSVERKTLNYHELLRVVREIEMSRNGFESVFICEMFTEANVYLHKVHISEYIEVQLVNSLLTVT